MWPYLSLGEQIAVSQDFHAVSIGEWICSNREMLLSSTLGSGLSIESAHFPWAWDCTDQDRILVRLPRPIAKTFSLWLSDVMRWA